jgi:hypothetical protein
VKTSILVLVSEVELKLSNILYQSLGNGRVSRVIRRGSRVIGRGSKVEVEGQKSRSMVKSRGRGSKVEDRNSRVENEKYYFFINTFLEHYIFGICYQNFKGSPDH